MSLEGTSDGHEHIGILREQTVERERVNSERVRPTARGFFVHVPQLESRARAELKMFDVHVDESSTVMDHSSTSGAVVLNRSIR